jgi:hypothetical protein
MMKSFLLALLLIQVGPPQPVGIVSGLVRGADGRPVEGMRVFAVTLRDAAEAATGPTVFEGLAQTDASGRYILELPPGRYYIACGSIAVPTYHPGTTNVAEARPVSIASGAQVNGVDFSSFVAPSAPINSFLSGVLSVRFNVPLPPLTTTMSGVIRLQDGSPAKGMEVIAIRVPQSPNLEVSSRHIPLASVLRGRADDSGRYHLVNVGDGSYYIVSGTRDIPTIYPGTSDITKATPVTVTLSQPVYNKNFTVSGNALGGRVTAAGGLPAYGAWVRVRTSSPLTNFSGPASLMSGYPSWETSVDASGSYSFGGLSPGSYIIESGAEDLPPQVRNVIVGNEAVKGIDFSLPIAAVSGRILFEDGSPVPDARILGSAVLSRTDNPDLSVSSILPVSGSGTFGSVMEPGEYKVKFPSMTPSYTIKSVTAGTHDLQKESLIVTTTESVTIEIRLEK